MKNRRGIYPGRPIFRHFVLTALQQLHLICLQYPDMTVIQYIDQV